MINLARMLEMLLQDESDDLESLKFITNKHSSTSSPRNPRSSTLASGSDDLFSKSDPLDDIVSLIFLYPLFMS